LVGQVVFDGADTIDLTFEAGAFLEDFLRAFLIIPKLGILGERIQFGKTVDGTVPVKDASSADRGRL